MASPLVGGGDPYKNPELFRFVGSMEGVPDWVDAAETAAEHSARADWQARAHHWFLLAGTLLPGVVLAGGIAALGTLVAEWIGSALFGLESTPVSPILCAIALGLAIRNSVGLPAVYELGTQLCLKRVLRLGVALLGIRLGLAELGAIGLAAVPIVLVTIATALLLVISASRALGLPPRLGILVAVGTAICGNTAIVATGPVIGADEDEVSYAVGCITVFGLLALIGYPFLAHAIFAGDAAATGLFLGTAIHDTAQVVGAGLLYAQQFGASQVLDVATVTKLVRNLFMLGVIPLAGVLFRRESAARGPRAPLRQLVPGFVLGFAALALVRSLGDAGDAPFGGLLSEDSWHALTERLTRVSTACLTIAMAAVGLGTSLERMRRLGLRPLAVGLVAALVVGSVSAVLIRLFGSALL
jgi:uncharacterized integral membrane protein (TIGR00698 family)